jgi:hypothetical protein
MVITHRVYDKIGSDERQRRLLRLKYTQFWWNSLDAIVTNSLLTSLARCRLPSEYLLRSRPRLESPETPS